HRGWSRCIGSRAVPASLAGTAGLVGAGTAGLLVIAWCAGAGPPAQAPHAKVTIVSGNLTFSSAAPGERRGAGPAHRTGAQEAVNHGSLGQGSLGQGSLGQGSLSRRVGDAIVAGLSGPGTRGAAPGVIIRARAAQAASRRSRASQGAAVPVDLRPDLGIRVAVRDGRLTGVSVRTMAGNAAGSQAAAGQALAGTYAPGSRSWRTRWALAPSQTYRVTATAVDSRGQRTVMSGTFRTLRPRRTFTAATTLGAGETVGVGMPIMIDFSRPITDKAAVERALQIWSSKPVSGAWYWVTSKSVWFRPRRYWPAHTRVHFTAHLAGLQGAPGVYGRAGLSQHFRIGDSLIAVASAATHYMKVWWNGRLAGDWPVSTGRPGMDTPDGRYLSFAMGSPVDMNSASYGVGPGMPGYYNELVYDAVQFTFSGDYVHSAPWSVGEQGVTNVSHGCVNVAPGYAAWFYGHSMLGDPISVVGSPVAGTWGDGWTIYFLGWRKLLAGSATGDAVRVSPDGSRLAAA
ncbi:MAG: Ig-like domain-containing protein, partial [Streptosporangiaceae bacterium]